MIQPYLARYPFLDAARAAVGEFDLEKTLEDEAVLDRAAERVVKGVNSGKVGEFKNDATLIELQSYPVARILVSIIGDYRIINRYAHAEAETAHDRLKADTTKQHNPDRDKVWLTLDEALDEFGVAAEETTLDAQIQHTAVGRYLDDATPDEIRAFANDTFGINPNVGDLANDDRLANLTGSEVYAQLHAVNQTKRRREDGWYRIPFSDYVPIAVGMSDVEWRLVNRGIADGHVVVNTSELLDLLEQAVFDLVVERLPHDVPEDWREKLTPLAEQVREDIDDSHFSYEIDRVEPGLYPPVIKQMLEDFPHALKHEEKVTLAAFFLHIGMTVEEVLETVGVINTPGEDPTRYQVKHIQQGGSDGEPYTPANYATIESWGYEWEKDALEQEVTNPLTYYKIKLKDQDDEDDEDGADNDSSEKASKESDGPTERVEDDVSLTEDDAGPDLDDVLADFEDSDE